MFVPGAIYKRSELHLEWGGATQAQTQGGILTPKEAPLVILITGSEGEAHGYEDWRDEDGVWHYFGQGQEGPMEWKRGNVAIRDHSINGKELHLFQSMKPSGLRYIGQFICSEFEVQGGVNDTHGHPREAIVFSLVPFDSAGVAPTTMDPEPDPAKSRWGMDLDELRERAAQPPKVVENHAPSPARIVYHRSEDLKVYVRRRANGICEGCGERATFNSKSSRQPYLEPHHTTRIADGGPDHPEHVIALCPNCHRRVHHGEDGEAYNELLKRQSREIESVSSSSRARIVNN